MSPHTNGIRMTKKESYGKTPQGATELASNMACFFYSEWYKKDISPNLTRIEKEKLLMKLSDYSLYHPFIGANIPKKEFPELELIPFSSTAGNLFTGSQLYTVMSELFNELHPGLVERPYPYIPDSRVSQ